MNHHDAGQPREFFHFHIYRNGINPDDGSERWRA